MTKREIPEARLVGPLRRRPVLRRIADLFTRAWRRVRARSAKRLTPGAPKQLTAATGELDEQLVSDWSRELCRREWELATEWRERAREVQEGNARMAAYLIERMCEMTNGRVKLDRSRPTDDEAN